MCECTDPVSGWQLPAGVRRPVRPALRVALLLGGVGVRDCGGHAEAVAGRTPLLPTRLGPALESSSFFDDAKRVSATGPVGWRSTQHGGPCSPHGRRQHNKRCAGQRCADASGALDGPVGTQQTTFPHPKLVAALWLATPPLPFPALPARPRFRLSNHSTRINTCTAGAPYGGRRPVRRRGRGLLLWPPHCPMGALIVSQ